MGMFRYEAVDRSGKVLRGVMNASNEQQVVQNLTKMGFSARGVYYSSGKSSVHTPSVSTAAQVQSRTNSMNSVTVASGVPVSVKSKVPVGRLAMFFRQLATLVKSGRPLNQSMTDVVVRDGRIRNALPHIQDSIQRGQSLSSAMAAFPDIFPVHTIASVWSGELSGRLDMALDEIAADFENETSENRLSNIGWGLTKLTIISFILMLPACNINNLLLPAAVKCFNTPGTDTSGVISMILRNYMHSVVTQGIPICTAIVLSWIVWGQMKRVPTLRHLLDGMLIHVPIWGPLHKYRALSRFLHILDGLMSAGINVSNAWDAASLTPRNSYIAEKLKLVRKSAAANTGISQMFVLSGVFEPDDIGLATAGEKSGSIPDVLAELSRIYDDRALATRKTARIWSVNIMIIFALIISGYVAITMAKSYFDLAFSVGDAIGK